MSKAAGKTGGEFKRVHYVMLIAAFYILGIAGLVDKRGSTNITLVAKREKSHSCWWLESGCYAGGRRQPWTRWYTLVVSCRLNRDVLKCGACVSATS